MHLMEYLCRPKHIAVVITLQSKLHSVSGRDASGGLTMRPLSLTVEDLGMKDGPARSEFCADSATVKHPFTRIKQELSEVPTLPHTYRHYMESHRVLRRILSL